LKGSLRKLHGLATAPASVEVSARTTLRWRTRILLRIMGGYVGRINVHCDTEFQ
jgi:hypothetical protein